MGLSFTVLGCSGSYAAPGSACTGYLVRNGARNVLLDCGPGTLANLQQHIDIAALDAVVITHCHPDHWIELPVLRNVWQWVVHKRGLPVYTTAETWDMAVAVSGESIGEILTPTIVTDGSEMTIDDQRWRFSRTDHPVETLAVRVDSDDRTFAFSADTGAGWSFEAFGSGIDIALCESTYTEATHPGKVQHLSARQAGATAAAARVQRLVLTHQLPGEDKAAHLDEAQRMFDRPIAVARIHESYDV